MRGAFSGCVSECRPPGSQERYFAGRDPVGVKFVVSPRDPKPDSSTIIGVVADVRQFGLDSEPTMDVYLADLTPVYMVVRTSGEPANLASAARAALQAVDPE